MIKICTWPLLTGNVVLWRRHLQYDVYEWIVEFLNCEMLCFVNKTEYMQVNFIVKNVTLNFFKLIFSRDFLIL